jgi:hypothetical protein
MMRHQVRSMQHSMQYSVLSRDAGPYLESEGFMGLR